MEVTVLRNVLCLVKVDAISRRQNVSRHIVSTVLVGCQDVITSHRNVNPDVLRALEVKHVIRHAQKKRLCQNVSIVDTSVHLL